MKGACPLSIHACVHLPDGRPIEVDPHHIIIEDPDGSCTLILDNMTADDSGQYMCFAVSSAGSASSLGKITVQGELLWGPVVGDLSRPLLVE